MFDEKDGQAGTLKGADECEHLGGFSGVHARRGFVEEEEARFEREGAGDFETAAVGVGQAVGRFVAAGKEAFAELGEDRFGVGAQVLFLGARESGYESAGEFGKKWDKGDARLGCPAAGVRADEDVFEYG